VVAAVQTPGAPTLSISFTSTNTALVSWPCPSTGWTLQQNTNSLSPLNWSDAPAVIQDDGTSKTILIG